MKRRNSAASNTGHSKELGVLEELHSMPMNRCDTNNFVYCSPHSNTTVVALSNGIIFMALRQEKSEFLIDPNSQTTKAESNEQSLNESEMDVSLSSFNDANELFPENKTSHVNARLFRTSIRIISAVELDYTTEDPISNYKPCFIGGLAGEKAESFYYDSIMAQKPANRQQTTAPNRSLTRTTGSHVTKIFSVLVHLDDASPTGREIIYAVTSTGGWYAFAAKQWVNAQQPVWSIIDSWRSTANLLLFSPVVQGASKPSQISDQYLRSIHSLCCSDLAAAESVNGFQLLYILNGLGQLLAYQSSVLSSSKYEGTYDLQPGKRPSGKLLTLPCEKAVSLCYISNKQCLAVGCENGVILLLEKITPCKPVADVKASDLAVSYEGSRVLWPHEDLFVKSLDITLGAGDDEVLLAAKGSFLTAFYKNSVAHCQIENLPIVSVSSIAGLNLENELLAQFLVSTQKGAYIVSLVNEDDSLTLSYLPLLAAGQVSSPLGTHSAHEVQPGVSAAVASNTLSSLNDSFKRRHLSSNSWLFLGANASPSFNFYMAACGIFSPCKASLLLAPPFSIKLFSRRCSTGLGDSWDCPFYELSNISEAVLLDLVGKIAIIENDDIAALQNAFLLVARAVIAYYTSCQQIPHPLVMSAYSALKEKLFKIHVVTLFKEVKELPATLISNLSKLGLELDISSNAELSTEFDKCLICQSELVLRREEANVVWVCPMKHLFHPCAKSLLPWLKPSSKKAAGLPLYCPSCQERTLRFSKLEETDAALKTYVEKTLNLPCPYCGTCLLP